MNQNKMITAGILVGALTAASPSYADDHQPSYLAGFTEKVTQGFFNVTTGFIELPKNIINISSDSNILMGMSWGVVRGVAHSVSRTVIGAAELITSPIPTDDYITPPFVWERFSEDTRYFGAHYPGFWTTYGPLDDGK
ncbi:MAG: hypothetical protein Kow0065_08840 [Methylomicrobium sp.]